MSGAPQRRAWSRRGLMHLVVGIQVLVLGLIVASQEVNRALDAGPAVELEIPQAHAQKDPFRGASVSGRPGLDLDGARASLPPERLEPGDRVLVFFSLEPGRRPRIFAVQRRGWGRDPEFSTGQFSLPGTVRRSGDRGGQGGGVVARIGTPSVPVELDLPASIPIEDAALDRLSGPSLIRASLHQGFLGYRYLADVRLSGTGWTEEMGFAYDAGRDRLAVFMPKRERTDRRPSSQEAPRSEIFFFDGLGQELRAVEVPGRVLGAAFAASDGMLRAVLSPERWGSSRVQLAQIGEDGAVQPRGPQFPSERALGFEAGPGALWILSGPPTSSPQPPYFVERMTPGGPEGPRLGPFTSKPQAVAAAGEQVWVLEPAQHRVTRLDRSGRVERVYRDLNGPSGMAVAAGVLMLIEANHTQLSRFSPEGEPVWRVPRFEGLAWVLPQPGSGGGWLGARRFEGKEGGVFRYEADGTVTRLPGGVAPAGTRYSGPALLAADAIQAAAQGRLYIRESRAIAILGLDGRLLKRLEGFRYAVEERVRG